MGRERRREIVRKKERGEGKTKWEEYEEREGTRKGRRRGRWEGKIIEGDVELERESFRSPIIQQSTQSTDLLTDIE